MSAPIVNGPQNIRSDAPTGQENGQGVNIPLPAVTVSYETSPQPKMLAHGFGFDVGVLAPPCRLPCGVCCYLALCPQGHNPARPLSFFRVAVLLCELASANRQPTSSPLPSRHALRGADGRTHSVTSLNSADTGEGAPAPRPGKRLSA